VLFNGSEMNRGGIIYAGNTTVNSYGAAIGGGTLYSSVGATIPLLPYATRIPSKSFEILWVPSEADMMWNADSAGNQTGAGQGFAVGSAVTICMVGMPSQTGVTIEVTGVYEVDFGASNNLVNSVGPPTTSTPWVNVLKGLWGQIKGSTVLLDGVKAALDYVGPAGPAVVGAKIARMAIGYL